MILSDIEIRQALRDRKIEITPPPIPEQFGSTTLDLRLGNEFKQWDPAIVGQRGVTQVIDFLSFDYAAFAKDFQVDVPQELDGSFILKKDAFILAKTLEKIHLKKTSNIAARIEGRSTTARLGFTIHITAPTIHCGYVGDITLEIKNFGPFDVKLRPGDQICQLIFERTSKTPQRLNSSVFQIKDAKSPKRR